jgi:hypothetical protein
MALDDHVTLNAFHLRGYIISGVFDDLIDRQAPTVDPARVVADIASDSLRLFRHRRVTVALLRLDRMIVSACP